MIPTDSTKARWARGGGLALALAVVASPLAPGLAAAAVPAATTAPAWVMTGRAGDGQVLIGWDRPAPAGSVLAYVAGTVAPTSAAAGTALAIPTGARSMAVTGLVDGTPVSFAAFEPASTGALVRSNPVTLTPALPRRGAVAVVASTTRVGPGGHLRLTGTYRDASGRLTVGVRLAVQTIAPGRAPATVATITTGTLGAFTVDLTPTASALYRVVVVPSPYDAAVSSSARAVTFVPSVTAALPSFVRVGDQLSVSGVARGAGGQAVTLQSETDGRWRTLATARPASTGAFRVAVRITATGSFPVRLLVPATATASAAATRAVTLSAVRRTLAPGSRGADVLAVQRALAGAAYDVGAVDGAYGDDVAHAVTAFQKVNGLARSGVVDAATVAALNAPESLPHRGSVSRGHSVEVDLTRQVVGLYVDNRLYRILDASTGSGQVYYQEGQRELATTPIGHYRIGWKIPQMHQSPLGWLFKPSFFYLGFAIHGDSSVLAYPASHGCVRITDSAVDRYYTWLTAGTPVYLFR